MRNLPAGWTGAPRQTLLDTPDAPPAAIADIHAIVHLEVKQHIPRPTPADIGDFTTVNVDGTRAWLDWAARHGIHRFVLLSSIKAVATGMYFLSFIARFLSRSESRKTIFAGTGIEPIKYSGRDGAVDGAPAVDGRPRGALLSRRS